MHSSDSNINSAGGGGNSEVRKSRIVAKNDKLADERVRDREKRAEVEAKQGERKQKKVAKSNKGEVDGVADDEDAGPETAGMHPARLAMMQQPARPTHRQRF
jgi:nucleolar protein 6